MNASNETVVVDFSARRAVDKLKPIANALHRILDEFEDATPERKNMLVADIGAYMAAVDRQLPAAERAGDPYLADALLEVSKYLSNAVSGKNVVNALIDAIASVTYYQCEAREAGSPPETPESEHSG